MGESVRKVIWRQQIGAPGRGRECLEHTHLTSHILPRRTMARKSQNRSVNASRRSSRLVEREEPGDASTRPPPSTEGASHGLLIQLAQQVQNLMAVIQDLRQPTNHRPSAEEPTLPSQHSRISRPDLRSRKRASHSRSGQRATRPQQGCGYEKRPRSHSSEEFSTSDSFQSV